MMRTSLILLALLKPLLPPTDPASYREVKLADGVYAFIAPTETDVVSGNSLVVIGASGALVVDTHQFAAIARWEIAEIEKLTDKPVRWVVNTHWHNDHWLGNADFRAAWPDAVFLATPNTRTLALDKGVGFVNDTSESQQQIAAIDKMLADRKLAAPMRTYMTAAREELRAFIPAMKEVRPEPPTTTFDRAVTIDLGGREVDVRFLGRGNTGGDAIVYVPDAKVLATGDLIVNPVPFAFGSFIGEWIDTLKQLDAIDATTIVPGHGEIEHDKVYVEQVIALLTSVRDQVRAAHAAGKTKAEAHKAVDLNMFKKAMCADDPWCQLAFGGAFAEPAIDRAYREAVEGPLHDED